MDLLSLIADKNVKQIIIEKRNILNELQTSDNEKTIDMQLSVKIVYQEQSEQTGQIKAPQTVSDYMKHWLYDFKRNELKAASFDRQEQIMMYQVLPYLGEIALSCLTTDDIQKMINKLKTEYSYSTVKKAYECINACLKYAVQNHVLAYNVADGAILPKNMQEPKEVRFFNTEQISLIEHEAVRCYKNGRRIYRLGEMIIFLLNTGLRIGEALALKWSDVDFQKKNIKIRKNVVFVKNRDKISGKNQKNYHAIEQNSLKTKSGDRIIPLNSDAMKALMSIFAINRKYQYIFSTSTGYRVSPRNIDRMFRSILRKCSIATAGVHTLRHTFVRQRN